MKYKVKDIDAESHHGAQLSDTKLEDKLERTVRCSSVLIGALALCLIALVAYTIVHTLSEGRALRPCVSEECVNTDGQILVVNSNRIRRAVKNENSPDQRNSNNIPTLQSKARYIKTDKHEEAYKTASRILSSLNKSVNPCDDFYEFACGGWNERNPVPEWSSSWDQLAKLRENLAYDLKELLEAKDEPNTPKCVLKAKALYRTCIDTAKLERDGLTPVSKLLVSLGLPATPPAAAGNQSWEVLAGRARRSLGIAVLLSVHISEDVRNTSRNRIVVEQVSPGFSDRYLLQPEKFSEELAQYHQYIRSVIAVADNETDAVQFADDIIAFSKSIAKIMTPVEIRRSGNHLFHEVSITQLITGSSDGPVQWKDMQWQVYFDTIFAETNVTLVPAEERLIVMDLPYMQKLSVLLADTPKITIERFIWWSVFSTVAPMTLSVFRDLGFTFSRSVYGLQARTPRWKSCVVNANANFGFALSYLYVNKHFDQTDREKAIEMIEDVREAFADTVQELDWMDNTTRHKTLSKLKAIRNFVGFPVWLHDTERLDKHYQHLEIEEGNLFETYLKLSWTTVKRSLEALRRKPDRSRWITTATTVNAFYSATLNSVTFPAGILQPPFYGNAIESINYGSIGAIMGHEITHGFDDQGRRYDEEGNLKQWWSAATLEHYHNKVQCIIDQYSQYHMPDLPNYKVQGFNTQGENIADNGGLRAALRAYGRLLRRRPEQRRDALPGLPHYSPEQLFYLGFAQVWCGNSTVGALKSKLVEGVHSPNKIRVIGTLSNSEEFSQAWGCPSGAPMNPENKCVLW